MFVYIIGNARQNIFKLGMASDPLKHLQAIQKGNPYKLSIISKARVQNKNAATVIEQLGRKRLGEYAGAGGWLVNLPTHLSAQFANDHYLRSLASRAGVKLLDRKKQSTPKESADLQRLTPIAKAKGMMMKEILQKVDQAYAEGISIDKII